MGKKLLLVISFTFALGQIFCQTTTTFNYTGGVQEYIVPPCVTEIEVVAAGAEGGGPNGGNGATVTAVFSVTPGQVLEVYVGGQGNCPQGGWNGGGSTSNGQGPSCGGGGASDIRVAPFGLANRIIVAGGGGGQGGGNPETPGGGAGGCATGTNGTDGFGDAGTGGSQIAGGNGGASYSDINCFNGPGEDGSLGQGGEGGFDSNTSNSHGGGGGGGYYGGGGGGSDCISFIDFVDGGGGGGGSSLTPAGGNCIGGNNTGNGYVTITPNNEGIELEVTPSASEICVGDSVEISVTGAFEYAWDPAIGLSSTTDSIVMASPPSTQTYLITASDGVDCSDTISVTVTVLPDPVVTLAPSAPEICPGESVDLTASGAGSFSWSPATGLSSDAGATVTAEPASTQTYTVTGTSGNCTADTSVTVTVLDLPTIEVSPADPELCPDGSVEIEVSGGTTYSWSPITGLDNPDDSVVVASPDATTEYTITGTDANGCISSTTVTATVLESPDVDAGEDIEICPGTSVELNGESATATDFSWSPTLSLDDPGIANPMASPDATTTYTLEVTDGSGCTNSDDVTVEVIDESYETTTDVSICEGESYTLPDGTDVSTSGTYENLFISVLGCDSLVITELQVLPEFEVTQEIGFCEGETFELADGTEIDAPGTYTVDLTTESGCDSIITYEVTVQELFEEDIEVTICETQSYLMPDGTEETEAGQYTFEFTSVFGCDSVINVDLSVQETIIVEADAVICDNEFYTLPDGEEVNEAGFYEVASNSGGCDTLFQINLSVNPTFESTFEASICEGESYTLPDGSSTGDEDIYTFNFQSIDGCDSTVIVDLTVIPIEEITQTAGICNGESYILPDGTEVEEEGVYPQVYTGANGCDSVVNIDLEVHPTFNINQFWSVCEGDNTYDPNGNLITGDGEYTLQYTSSQGCDSVVNLTVSYHPTYTETIVDSICRGDQYVTKKGLVITESGTYQDVFLTDNDCDSTFVYEITVQPKPNAFFTADPRIASVYDGPVRFSSQSEGATSVLWDFGSFGESNATDTLISFGGIPGFYPICIDATNEYGCVDQYCADFEVRENFVVYIPNAFTPNGDGINDLFFIQGKNIDPDDFLLEIFNEYGEVVFRTTDPGVKWNGASQRNEHFAQTEVYVYRAVVAAQFGIERREFTGKVSVIR